MLRLPFSLLPRTTATSALLLALALAAPAAAEDRITVKGDTLRGQIVDVTPDGVSFDPIHGEGAILIAWDDVEDLASEGDFAVLYGDDGEATGRLLGLDAEGRLLVGEAPATAQRISVGKLFHGYSEQDFATTYDRLHSTWRYWTASFDAGALFVDSTTDTSSGSTAFRMERRRSPTRFEMEGAWRYATEKESGEDRNVTENNLYGFTRGELDTTDRTFTYASFRATHDADRHLALRVEPRGGVGVRLIERPRAKLSTDVGAAWIYEDYYGSEPVPGAFPLVRSRGHDNHWALAFGAQAEAKLLYGVVWRAKGEYLPAVDAWTRDYLMRGETSLEFPLLRWLSFRVALADEYDNSPADGAARNKVTTTAALSLRF